MSGLRKKLSSIILLYFHYSVAVYAVDYFFFLSSNSVGFYIPYCPGSLLTFLTVPFEYIYITIFTYVLKI